MAQEKATTTLEEPVSQATVDEAIAGIEKLYETLAGSPPPAGGQTYSPIPVERNPSEFVAERLELLLRALGQPPAAPGWAWMPPMVVWESGGETVICLDLPGVKRTEIEIVDEGGVVTVSGKRSALDGRLQLAERPLGSFRRQIPLPRNVRKSELRAKLADGVLEIHLPKETAGESAKKIEIGA